MTGRSYDREKKLVLMSDPRLRLRKRKDDL